MITFHSKSLIATLYCSMAAVLLTTALFAALLMHPTTAEAKTVSASDTYSGKLLYQSTANIWTHIYFLGLENLHATVHYNAIVRNMDTNNVLADGTNVPVGTVLRFEPQLGDISWVGTGGFSDTPTGSWVPGARLGESTSKIVSAKGIRYNTAQCKGVNYTDTFNTTSWDGEVRTFDVFTPFSVNPPTQTVNVSGTASLTPLGGNQYRVDGPGTIAAVVTFGDTYGRYYYQYTGSPRLPGGTCLTSFDAMPLLELSSISAPPGDYPDARFITTDPTPYIYNAQFAAQTINYSLTAVGTPPPSNNPPTDPTHNAPAEVLVGDLFTIDFVSTDPDGDDVYYEIDWNNDGVTDQRVPSSGYVAEGTNQSVTRTFSTPKTDDYRVRVIDQPGATSNWVGDGYEVKTASSNAYLAARINTGNFAVSDIVMESSDTLALRWSGSNLASCTGTNFNTGGSPSNGLLTVPTPTTGTTITYTLDCIADDGTVVPPQSLNVTVSNTPLATVTLESRVNGAGAWTTADQTINASDSVEMRWTSTNAVNCTGQNALAVNALPVPSRLANTVTISNPTPGTSETRGVTCFNADVVPTSDNFTLTVNAPPAPVVTLETRVNDTGGWSTADRTINVGDSVELQWSSTNAVSCSSPDAAVSGINGTTTIGSLPAAGASRNYVVTCLNSAGNPGGAGTSITVNAPPTPTLSGSGCSDIAIGDSTCEGLVTWKDGDNVYNDTQGAVAYTSANGSNQSISLKRGNNQIQLRDSSNAVLADTSLTASCDSASSVWSAAQNVCAPLPPTVTVDLTVNGGAPTVPFTPTDDVKVEWTSTPTASECQWVDDYGGTLPPISGPNDIVTISPAALTLGSTINFAIECRREVSGIASDWAQDSVSGSMAIPTLELSLAQSLVRSGTVTDVTWGVSDITGTGFVLECDLILPGRAPLSDTFTTDRDQTDLTGEVTSVFNVTLSCIETTTGQQIIESERLEVVPTTQEI